MSASADGRRTRAAPAGAAALVWVDDEQSDVAIDVAALSALASAVLEDEGIRAPCELALRLVDAETIAVLNGEHLGGDGPTDVLAFPLDSPPLESPLEDPLDLLLDDRPASSAGSGVGGMPVLLGDVVVCPAVAARQAAEGDRPTEDELALLVIHGILHVLGMDHAEPAEATVMLARQQALLARHHRGPAG